MMNFEKYVPPKFDETPPLRPKFPTKPVGERSVTSVMIRLYAAEVEKHADDIEKWEISRDAYKERYNAHNKIALELLDQFKIDAIVELCLEGNPKAEAAYEMAWERGHSSGLHNVFNEFEELAMLIY